MDRSRKQGMEWNLSPDQPLVENSIFEEPFPVTYLNYTCFIPVALFPNTYPDNLRWMIPHCVDTEELLFKGIEMHLKCHYKGLHWNMFCIMIFYFEDIQPFV